MRRTLLCAAAVGGVLLFSARGYAQTRGGQVEGFGGMTFGNTASARTFGGSVAVPMTDNIQLIGEAGRLDDLKSSLLDVVSDFTPVDVNLAAWYGEGGVRFIASPRSAVRPYAEATAGAARLTPGVGRGGTAGTIANSALALLSTTEPLFGAGAGVIFHGGPVIVDAGYRYKRIGSGNAIASALSLGGGPIEVNQMRVGIGFRF